MLFALNPNVYYGKMALTIRSWKWNYLWINIYIWTLFHFYAIILPWNWKQNYQTQL